MAVSLPPMPMLLAIDWFRPTYVLSQEKGRSPGLRIEMMRGAGLGERQEIEVLPVLDNLALADLTHQHDRQIKLCAWSWFLSRRRWPLIGDHSGMRVLP